MPSLITLAQSNSLDARRNSPRMKAHLGKCASRVCQLVQSCLDSYTLAMPAVVYWQLEDGTEEQTSRQHPETMGAALSIKQNRARQDCLLKGYLGSFSRGALKSLSR